MRHDALALVERDDRVEQNLDDREGASRHANANRHAEHADQAEARVAPEHPAGELEIHPRKARGGGEAGLPMSPPLAEAGADDIANRGADEPQRMQRTPVASPRRQFTIEGVDHLGGVHPAVPARKGTQARRDRKG